MLSLRFMEPSI